MTNGDDSIVLVGAGRMGGALLAGWLERGVARANIRVVEPAAPAAQDIARRHGVAVAADPASLPASPAPGIVVFAVKPQGLDAIAPAYRRFAGQAAYLSIVAGKTIATFERHLGDRAAIVRSMPNTPAAVRRGITVACANANVTPAQRAACQALLEAVGEVAWVADEALLDPVTAVSASGPAYVFWFIEQLAAAGASLGLPLEISKKLALETVLGSARLAAQSSDSPSVLRERVTSKGGTTAAALEVFDEERLAERFRRAIEAASRRGAQMGEEFGKS